MKTSLLIAVLGISLFFVSCSNGNESKTTEQVDLPVEKKQIGEGNAGIAMAFYYQDSIVTQFKFYREIDSLLKSKELNFQKELEAKYRSYQAYEADIQKRMQANEITGYQIEEIQQTVLQKQQAIQQFEQQRGAELQNESMQYQTALMNKIAEAGKEFSSKKEIDLLFFYQKGGQITFINNAYDVTDEFITFLNKREEELISGFEEEIEAIQDSESK